MRYIDENGNFIPEPDPFSGWGENTEIVTARHEAEAEVPDVFHYEVVRVYRNGGQDLVKVIDVPGHPYIPAWDEYEEVILWHFIPPPEPEPEPPPPPVYADRNCSAGEIETINGAMVEFLDNVAAGCQIIEGRNARKTSVEEQLEKLKEQT